MDLRISDNYTATTLSVIAGVLVLVTGMSTPLAHLTRKADRAADTLHDGCRGRPSPDRGSLHRGFSDHGGSTRFFVIAGALELGTALMTHCDEREEVGAQRRTRTSTAR